MSRARFIVPSLLAALLLGAPGAGAVEADGTILVTLNYAHVMRFPEKTSTVVIGNPIIADIAIQKGGIVVVTGKSYGTTNLLVLDQSGTIISESKVTVTGPKNDNTVLVQRGMDRETYACNPTCMPSVRLGDSDKYLGETAGQVERHTGLSARR